MPIDYGPRPRINRINPMPSLKRVKKLPSREEVENKLMGRLIYFAGKIAGKQAAMTAYNYGLRDPEKLKYVRNFAQDEARSDTLRLLDELRAGGGLPEVLLEARQPEKIEREELFNIQSKQLKEDWI